MLRTERLNTNKMRIEDLDTIRLDDFVSIIHISNEIDKRRKQGKKRVVFFVENSPAYPNTCVPLAAIIDYYKKIGITTDLIFLDDLVSYASNLNIDNPYRVEDEHYAISLDYPFDIIWTFETPKGQNVLVSAIVDALRRTGLCGDGIFSGLEWCLNETMDNVLTHSQSGKGFIMAQYHQTKKSFSFCVFDYGIGIYNSFINSTKYHPRTRVDAITLALQEKVTRDDKIGQGNGLWGLHQIIEESAGSLKNHIRWRLLSDDF